MKRIFVLILCSLLLTGCYESEGTETNYENETSSDYTEGQEKANELIEEMENIDWEEKYDDARDKGREAAEFLNDLLD